MRFRILAASLLALPACLLQIAEAATVDVIQLWEERNFANNGLHASTFVRYDDAALSGSGDERIIVDYLSMTIFRNNVGQNFSVADFNEPHDFNTEGNIFVRYVDGLFIGFGDVNTGGAARTTLRTGSLSGGISGGINIGRDQLIWHNPVSGRNFYNLVSTEFLGQMPVVPLPSSVWLFATALLGFIGFARRRNIS